MDSTSNTDDAKADYEIDSQYPELILPYDLKLLPFQEETVRKTLKFLSLNKSKSCYVANEPGLGKSVTSLVTANTLHTKRVLIICPAIMRLVWQAEIYKWCRLSVTSFPKVCTILTSPNVAISHTASYVICSYTLASQVSVLKNLCSQSFDMLIVDEAHCCKNKKAARTKAVLIDLWKISTYKILLSGTPMTNSSVDLYMPFHTILPDSFPSFAAFVEKYSYQRITPWGIQYYGLKNASELSKTIRDNFYIRYRKVDVLKDLPPKQWQKIILPRTYSVEVAIKDAEKLKKEQQQLLEHLETNATFIPPATLAEHRRLQGEKKASAVAEFCEELLEQEIPIVVFAHHKSVVAAIAKALDKYKPRTITGESSSQARQEAIDDFQNGKFNCLVANIVAAGVGCTLTRSTTVIMAEMSYSPAENDQAVCRCHRIGTKGQVMIYYFVVQDSIDEAISEIIARKTRDFGAVCDAASN